MIADEVRHWHRPLAPATLEFVDGAPLDATPKGLKATVEVTAYPGGQVAVSTSTISGAPGSRTIVQSGTLMFNDVNEAKDAVDALLDRLDSEAERLGPASADARIVEINSYLHRQLLHEGIAEVDAVTAAQWLDAAGLLADSRSRRGKPLRDLLRAGLIEGSEQRPPRPWGRWYITRATS